MLADRIGLIGLGAIILTATAALAQNTTNPVLSGQSTLLQARSELSVSPATPTGLLTNTTGTNPLTGLPCTGPDALSISGAGGLARLDDCTGERKYDCRRSHQSNSNTGVPKRVSTRRHLGRVLT
jgi:hypothetical protein